MTFQAGFQMSPFLGNANRETYVPNICKRADQVLCGVLDQQNLLAPTCNNAAWPTFMAAQLSKYILVFL